MSKSHPHTTTRPVSARRRSARAAPPPKRDVSRTLLSHWRAVAGVVGSTFVIVVGLVIFGGGGNGSSGGGGQYAYAVAQPATGAVAPGFALPATTGGNIDLKTYRGKTVLLYFHEGIGCEPCWTQMQDIQKSMSDFRAKGIDAIVTITTNTLPQLQQKVSDEGLTMPVLADSDFTVSHEYNANQYGMMGTSADGHSFILVGPDGTIRWRADYGGSPNYTMYVPVAQLLNDMNAGLVQR